MTSHEQGRGVDSVEVLAREALERTVDDDDWFIREVEAGLAQIEVAQTLTDKAVGACLAKKLTDHDTCRDAAAVGGGLGGRSDRIADYLVAEAPEMLLSLRIGAPGEFGIQGLHEARVALPVRSGDANPSAAGRLP